MPPGEQRAAKVNDLFARIARRYDLINDLQSFGLHRLWKRRVVKLAKIKNGERALDLCCGTGDIAFALARRGAETTGLDFSPQMLEVAAQRKQKAEKIRQSANRQSKIFAGRRAANSVSGKFLRHRDHRLRAAQPDELAARAGGNVPRGPARRAADRAGFRQAGERGSGAKIYFAHLRCSVPLIGLLFCGNASAYAYILESLKHYPAQLAVAEKMRGAETGKRPRHQPARRRDGHQLRRKSGDAMSRPSCWFHRKTKSQG